MVADICTFRTSLKIDRTPDDQYGHLMLKIYLGQNTALGKAIFERVCISEGFIAQDMFHEIRLKSCHFTQDQKPEVNIIWGPEFLGDSESATQRRHRYLKGYCHVQFVHLLLLRRDKNFRPGSYCAAK